ncbi:MAG: hypothetical protein R2729_22465 [Bryobacteraceae bacterium]
MDGNFELFAADVTPERASRPERVTRSPYGDFNVRAAPDAKGNVTIAWQSFRAGNADVYARRRGSNRRWSPEVLVSACGRGDWEPAIALDSMGRAWISWDGYEHANYDVFQRSVDGVRLGPVTPVTTEPSAQFQSTVAVGEDRVWVVEFGASSGGLRWKRTIGVRACEKGKLHEPASQPGSKFTGRMTQSAELPHLAVDKSGALTMVFRHWTDTKPNEMHHFYGREWWTAPGATRGGSGRVRETTRSGLPFHKGPPGSPWPTRATGAAIP